MNVEAIQCDQCGELTTDQMTFYKYNQDDYCECCYYELVDNCSKCEEKFKISEMVDTGNGEVCQNCYDELKRIGEI